MVTLYQYWQVQHESITAPAKAEPKQTNFSRAVAVTRSHQRNSRAGMEELCHDLIDPTNKQVVCHPNDNTQALTKQLLINHECSGFLANDPGFRVHISWKTCWYGYYTLLRRMESYTLLRRMESYTNARTCS